MSLDNLPEVDRKELLYSQHELNALFNSVLNDLSRSAEEIKLPFPVLFPKGNVDSLSARVAANSVRELNRKKELIIAVEPGFSGPLYSVSQCSFMNRGKVDDTRFIGAFFVGNFFARSRVEAPNPKAVVKRAITEIAYQDVAMSAQKIPRAVIPRGNSEDLVFIYSGPKFLQRPASG